MGQREALTVHAFSALSCFKKNVVMELSFVRFQETRRSRAQVLKAKPRKTYLFTGTASKFNNFKA